MGFTEAIRTCFRKYVGFSGRAARPEYWWFVLFVFVGSIVAGIIDRILFGGGPMAGTPITSIFQLAIFLPLVAAGWRRIQDTGKPGWLILLPVAVSLISMVGVLGGVFGFGMMQGGGMAPERDERPCGDDGWSRVHRRDRRRTGCRGADDLVADASRRSGRQQIRSATRLTCCYDERRASTRRATSPRLMLRTLEWNPPE